MWQACRVLARGEAGLFEGSERDQVVFGTYRREGRWSAPLVALLRRLVGPGGTLIDVGARQGFKRVKVGQVLSGNLQCERAIEFDPEIMF